MPYFEVFIPAADENGFNITTKIEAATWILALRSGLSQLGDAADIQNIMVDVTDSGMVVTEPTSGRVFRIRELAEGTAIAPASNTPAVAPAPVAMSAITTPPPGLELPAPPPPAAPVAAAPPPPAAPVAILPPVVVAAPPPPAAPVAIPPPVIVAPAAPPPPAVPVVPAPPPVVVAPAAPPPPAVPVVPAPALVADYQGESLFTPAPDEVITAEVVKGPASMESSVDLGGREHAVSGRSVDEIIGDLFEKTQELYEHDDLAAASRCLLAMACEVVPCESGAVFIADINANDLYFAAAIGPKSDDVMDFRVPIGVGIVGFCAQSGVSLAVADVEKDPQFSAAIAKKLGYTTNAIVCSPAQIDGRVYGALELINRKGGNAFTDDEVSVVNFLATAFANYLVATGQTGD